MGSGGPVIDIERGLRDVGSGIGRGFEDVFGITDARKRLKKLQKGMQPPDMLEPEDSAISEVARERERRRRAALRSGRQGTLLTGGAGTLLGGSDLEPKTLLGA